MDEQPIKKGMNPFFRFLLFLLMLVAILGLLLLALTGLAPQDLVKGDVPSIVRQVQSAFGEKEPQEQITSVLGEQDPSPYMAIQGDNVVLATAGEIRALSANGTQRWSVAVHLAEPIVSVHGQDVLYADLDGKNFGLVRDGSVFFEKQSNNRIVGAALSRDFILLLTKGLEAGYTAIMEGYSRDGATVFTSYFTDYTPFSVFHKPESGQDNFFISGLSVDGLKSGAVVEYMSPNTERLGGITAEDDLYAVLLQSKDGKTALVGEHGLKFVDKDLAAAGEYSASGNRITAAALLDETFPVVALRDEKRYQSTRQEKSWLRILHMDGSVKWETVVDGSVNRLLSGNGFIGIVQEDQVLFIDALGNELFSFFAKGKIDDVVVSPGGLAYILSDRKITAVRVIEKKGLFR